jgi:hypothetical protein
VRICVSDTGPGIPVDKHVALFQPFSRLGAEVTEIEGTGIGLALTKKLVGLMGGSIGFESMEGEGGTFWIDMPRAKRKLFGKGKASGGPRKFSISRSARKFGPCSTWKTTRPTCASWRKL